MSTLPLYRRPEGWGERAASYDDLFAPFSRVAARRVIELCDIQPGERFLDIAAGTGAVTLAAADAGARVTAIDFSEGMIERLRGKLRDRRSQEEVEVLHMDGQSLDLDDATFDGAASAFGLVFFPDPVAALGELHRVLRRGARAVICSTGHPASSELQPLIGQALVAAGARPVGPVGPAFAPTAAELGVALSNAGFAGIRTETVQVAWPVPDPKRFWDGWVLDSPVTGDAMTALPARIREAAGNEFVELVRATGRQQFSTEVAYAVGER